MLYSSASSSPPLLLQPEVSSNSASTPATHHSVSSSSGGSSRHSSLPEGKADIVATDGASVSMQSDVAIGKLVVFNEEVLGHGSQGTTVYRWVDCGAGCMGIGGGVHGDWGQGAWGLRVGCLESRDGVYSTCG